MREGSSPLARGLRGCGQAHETIIRIIPARAGFTCDQHGRRRGGGDHPRSRGVYSARSAAFAASNGSSPLARGLLKWLPAKAYRRRIIPARAGFTDAPPPSMVRAADHPRSRGVYPWGRAGRRGRGGSSPLARGLLSELPQRTIVRRIIPARAGFTGGREPAGDRGTDHPRSRGVYESSPDLLVARPGSSPLARGLPESADYVFPHGGIIPARAGFTATPTRQSN